MGTDYFFYRMILIQKTQCGAKMQMSVEWINTYIQDTIKLTR